jgi:acyl carrier protein
MEIIEAKIMRIAAKQLNVEKNKIIPESHFVEDLGADSLDIVELLMVFEEEFGLEIPDEDAQEIATIKKAAEYIKKRMREK